MAPPEDITTTPPTKSVAQKTQWLAQRPASYGYGCVRGDSNRGAKMILIIKNIVLVPENLQDSVITLGWRNVLDLSACHYQRNTFRNCDQRLRTIKCELKNFDMCHLLDDAGEKISATKVG
jgi:hypothetical protein